MARAKKTGKSKKPTKKGRPSTARQGGHFVSHYLASLSAEDYKTCGAATLSAIAKNHLKGAASRRQGTALVSVFNPEKKKHGYVISRTVVEIVNDDMPFLYDSVTAELNRLGLSVHLAIHPIVHVARNAAGKLAQVVGPGEKNTDAQRESFMHIQVNLQSTERLEEIKNSIEAVLSDVRLAVGDWRTMRGLISEIADDIGNQKTKMSAKDTKEVQQFLQWLHDDHFTFLGYREYAFTKNGSKGRANIVKDSALGILSDSSRVVLHELRNLKDMPPEVRAFVSKPDLLMVNKANTLSRIHRPVHLDTIGIKRMDSRGNVVGLRVFVGLFAAGAYNKSVRDIPVLRQKVQKTFDAAGLAANSHDGKVLLNILETYPRDELFQVSSESLLKNSIGILRLQDRQQVALFLRKDDFERFISCMIFIPRDRYTTDLRLRMQGVLERTFNGKVTAQKGVLGEQALARLHVTVSTTPGAIPKFSEKVLEEALRGEARTWADNMSEALIKYAGETEGVRLLEIYGEAFDAGYRQRFEAGESIGDIKRIEQTFAGGHVALNLYRNEDEPPTRLRFKMYHPSRPIALSGVLPMLEDLGLNVIEEIPHRVHPKNASDWISIHDFGLEPRGDVPENLDGVRDAFHAAFARVWSGEMESDALNALVLFAGLDWREVTVLRAFFKYLRQAGISFSEDYMAETLIANPRITKGIVDMFKAKFDPASGTTDKDVQKAHTKTARIRKRVVDMLDDVESADQDRILRRMINLVDAMLRTNFFQNVAGAPGTVKPYLSFKLSSRDVEELPLPRPRFEIFVYSPTVEGIHLRFGSVARGGLRWSDRREDFRTEILGLVKAQQVKNAVIVPVGSKGGFVVKRPPSEGGREAFLAEGIACYQNFIRGLLDITDNLSESGRIKPPPQVLRHDDDDPYLVVAADKGTATFSDIANAVSDDYGFWLGDAFASGGSVGYDHKKMGITARGGWESVKRHFREMDIDTQSEPFTVAGVGDMSGDVFGNGMLLSPHINLQAAFNHLHIFIDPNPNAAATLKERKRLFDLPRSGWADYNAKLISKGGGIYERKAKWIELSAEMKAMFETDAARATPNELMRMVLGMKVDLLWFGGIGTYIKSSTESNVDAGDRTNDAVRLNAPEVRARVIGEGANLGMTQRARVEYALSGGRLNTDSIDNSAGVDCSDHEVNIKILLDRLVATKKLTQNGRNQLLEKMTDEVGALVLRDNYLQTQAISVIQARGADWIDHQQRLMRQLEKRDRLNRAVEFLPDDETLNERAQSGQGLTRPEISVLMSYSKIWLYDELLESTVPDDVFLVDDLISYFPTPLQKKYEAAINSHRLMREIVATRVTNSMINRVGGTFATQLQEKTGMNLPHIARAYIIAREVFGLRALWSGIEALDNKVPARVQTAMFLDINRLLDRATTWFLRNSQTGSIKGAVEGFQKDIATLAGALEAVIPTFYREDLNKRAAVYIDEGAPKALAKSISGLVNLASGIDIVRLAQARRTSVREVAKLYFVVGARFRLGRLRGACETLEGESHWQKLAVAAHIEELFQLQADLTGQILSTVKKQPDAAKALEQWTETHHEAVERTDQLLGELRSGDINDLSMVAVASRSLRALADDTGQAASPPRKAR